MDGAPLLLPSKIKQEPSESDTKVQVDRTVVNSQNNSLVCTCKKQESASVTIHTQNNPVSAESRVLSTATRQVLVNFGLNRKKVFSLEDGVSLKSKLEAYIQREEAFADLLENCYIVLQVFSEKFSTWVDVEDSDLEDSAVVNALFFPRKVEGNDNNPGGIKKRKREEHNDNESKRHSKARNKEDCHNNSHRKKPKRNKERVERNSETFDNLEEGELPPDDDESDVVIVPSETRKKKKKCREDRISPVSPQTPLRPNTPQSSMRMPMQPQFPPQPPQPELLQPLLPPHMMMHSQAAQPMLSESPLSQPPQLQFLEQQQPQQQQLSQLPPSVTWMLPPSMRTWQNLACSPQPSPELYIPPVSCHQTQAQRGNNAGKKKNKVRGKRKRFWRHSHSECSQM